MLCNSFQRLNRRGKIVAVLLVNVVEFSARISCRSSSMKTQLSINPSVFQEGIKVGPVGIIPLSKHSPVAIVYFHRNAVCLIAPAAGFFNRSLRV